MYILGISCFYHDSSASLIADGKVIAAAQEERFNRVKASSDFPIKAINFCLKQGQITTQDLDYIVFYEKPYLKFERVIKDHLKSYPFSISNFLKLIPHWLQDRLSLQMKIEEELGYEGKILYVPHHLSHASSAFFCSPFAESAIITADAVGEFDTTTIGVGKKNQIKLIKKLSYPHSLGLLYTSISTYLGFKANTGEGKVMGLAALGQPKYLNLFKEVIHIKNDGSFQLNEKYFSFNSGSKMFSKNLEKLLGPARKMGNTHDKNIEQKYLDIAASLQAIVEEIIIKIAKHTYKETGLKKLCLAGGVFLNCVANTRILKETPFDEIFIQPAAGDAGGSLGAALYAHHHFLNKSRSNFVMKDAFLGPFFTEKEILQTLRKNEANYKKLSNKKLITFVAKKIHENKIIGWFEGRMEFGPRALGHRTILANPCNKHMKDLLNQKIKHREWFRPYGIIIPENEVANYFQENIKNPFMLMIGNVKKNKAKLIPSAIHYDGTSRLQTITKKTHSSLYDVINEFKKLSGIPILINTSFNDNNEPIVCTPQNAYDCFMKTEMDFLVMGNYLVKKQIFLKNI
jgi:carbamoyltransferase